MFLTERKIVPWHWRPVAIIMTKTAINSIKDYITVIKVNKYLQDDASSNELNLFRVSSQVKIPGNTQLEVLVSCQGSGLTMNETHSDVVERLCFMITQGLMDILPWKPFTSTSHIGWRLNFPSSWQSLMLQVPQHSSYTQQMMSHTCWQIRARY